MHLEIELSGGFVKAKEDDYQDALEIIIRQIKAEKGWIVKGWVIEDEES